MQRSELKEIVLNVRGGTRSTSFRLETWNSPRAKPGPDQAPNRHPEIWNLKSGTRRASDLSF